VNAFKGTLNLKGTAKRGRSYRASAPSPKSPEYKIKKHRFCRHGDIRSLGNSYPEAETSRLNRLMTSTLEFEKINE